MQDIVGVSRTFLDASRRELEAGLTENNHLKVRQAGGRRGTRGCKPRTMRCTRGGHATGGPRGRPGTEGFFERIGRSDLSEKYTYFAKRLHGDVFYGGADVPPEAMRRYLDEVRGFIEGVASL